MTSWRDKADEDLTAADLDAMEAEGHPVGIVGPAHVPSIRPSQKLDLFQPAWAPTCSCSWDPGGVMSERNARSAAQRHADAKNAEEGDG